MTTPLLNSDRAPRPAEPGAARYQRCARVSWISLLISFAANALLQVGSQGSRLSHPPRIFAILTCFLALTGITSGLAAFFGIRRFGRKRILWPALIGVSLWLCLFALAIPPFLNARRRALQRSALTPAQHNPAATRVSDAELGFSFELPGEFQIVPPSPRTADFRHSYIKRDPNQANELLLVKVLGRELAREHLKAAQLPPGSSVTLTSFPWRGLQVDATRVSETSPGTNFVTFNVQIPLRTQAIQLSLGGPGTAEGDLRGKVEQVLASLEGETNW